MDEDHDEVSDFLKLPEFQKSFAEQVKKDTWGNGLPMIYMNDENQIIEHWEDGRIIIIKDKIK